MMFYAFMTNASGMQECLTPPPPFYVYPAPIIRCFSLRMRICLGWIMKGIHSISDVN